MTDTLTRPRPHPRIRARRAAVQKEAGRRRLRFVLIALALAAVVPVAWGVTRSPLLDVDHVAVSGAGHTARDAIVEAAALPEAMTDISERASERRIEQLPWVQTARVTRDWPATVAIVVTERTPVAVVRAGEAAWALVDRYGRVLAPAGGPDPAMPVVVAAGEVGPPGSALGRDTAPLVALGAELDEELAARVDLIRLVGAAGSESGGGVELVLDNGAVVSFGPLREVNAKVVALRTLVNKADLRGVATIDVRVPSAPVLTRR